MMSDSNCSVMGINKLCSLGNSKDVVVETPSSPAQSYYRQSTLDEFRRVRPVVWKIKKFGRYRHKDYVKELVPQYVYDMAMDGKCSFSKHVRDGLEDLVQDKLPTNSGKPFIVVAKVYYKLPEKSRNKCLDSDYAKN